MSKDEVDVKSDYPDEDDPFGPSNGDFPDEEQESDEGEDATTEALKSGESPDESADLKAEGGKGGERENARVRDLVDQVKNLTTQNQELMGMVNRLANQPKPQVKPEPGQADRAPWERDDWDDRILSDPKSAFQEANRFILKHSQEEMESRFQRFGSEFGQAMQFLSANPEFAEAVTNGSLQKEMRRRGLNDLYTTYLVVDNERLRAETKKGIKTGEQRAATNRRMQRERAPAPESAGGGNVAPKEDLTNLTDHDWGMAIAQKLIDGEHLPRSRRGA